MSKVKEIEGTEKHLRTDKSEEADTTSQTEEARGGDGVIGLVRKLNLRRGPLAMEQHSKRQRNHHEAGRSRSGNPFSCFPNSYPWPPRAEPQL